MPSKKSCPKYQPDILQIKCLIPPTPSSNLQTQVSHKFQTPALAGFFDIAKGQAGVRFYEAIDKTGYYLQVFAGNLHIMSTSEPFFGYQGQPRNPSEFTYLHKW